MGAPRAEPTDPRVLQHLCLADDITYVWLMTSSISRGRLWLGIGFLLLIAGSFLVSSTLGEVRTLMTAA